MHLIRCVRGDTTTQCRPKSTITGRLCAPGLCMGTWAGKSRQTTIIGTGTVTIKICSYFTAIGVLRRPLISDVTQSLNKG